MDGTLVPYNFSIDLRQPPSELSYNYCQQRVSYKQDGVVFCSGEAAAKHLLESQEEIMNGRFVQNGTSFTVAAKANSKEKEIEVILPPGLADGDKYKVEKKDLPEGLPPTWRGNREITWFNNFGLKEKGKSGFVSGEVPESYEIIMDKETGKIPVYYDGEVKAFPQEDHGDTPGRSGKVSARLKLGDPPCGSG